MAVPNAAVARVEIVEVNAEGMGLTLGDAILDGLQSAVSMVNGVEVASQTRLEMATVSTETNQAESYTAASAFSKDITTATEGVVDGYDVLSSGRDSSLGNNYVVQLVVRISKLKQSKQLNRLRMAVSGLYVDDNVSDRRAADATALAIQNRVIDYLTQTRRFAMIDRNNIADTQTELNYIATSGMATRELARLGNKVGTDYLVVMILRELNTNIYQKKMKTNNRIKETKQVVGEVSVRILDVATSQIKFSDTILIQSDRDYRALAKDGGRVIGQTIQNAIYPARIVAIDGDTVTIGQGGKTFARNEIYELVQLGERMIDPYTKESLGFQEIPVGKIKIERVQSKQSTGRIIEITLDDATQLIGYKHIVRPLRSNSTANLEENRKSVKKAKSRIEEMKQSFN
jgi:hypothetical protein